MSIEKNMNTRIQHKHDIEANWNKALNFIPKKGELIVYDPDENYNYSRVKIGDGIRKVNDLPFVDVQSDWNQSDSTQIDFIKNKPLEETEDDAMEMLAEMGIIEPVINEDGAIYTDENGAILTI